MNCPFKEKALCRLHKVCEREGYGLGPFNINQCKHYWDLAGRAAEAGGKTAVYNHAGQKPAGRDDWVNLKS